jgi:hypothetical protein
MKFAFIFQWLEKLFQQNDNRFGKIACNPPKDALEDRQRRQTVGEASTRSSAG